MQKKEGKVLTQKDLGDVVYDSKMPKSLFVNTHGSELMTTLLVVVHKKKIDSFRQLYPELLIQFNQTDFENWKKRTRAHVAAQNQNIEDEEQRMAIIEEEFSYQLKIHEKQMDQPGVVPMSDKYLDNEDAEGNQLWRITIMKETAAEYIRLLKKSGFVSQEFNFDQEKHVEDQKIESQLRVDLGNVNLKLLNTCFYNFQELFQALLHLKVMRTYIDGVLRFGIPPRFFLGIIKPTKNMDNKIMQRLTDTFAEEHLREMYGQKEDA